MYSLQLVVASGDTTTGRSWMLKWYGCAVCTVRTIICMYRKISLGKCQINFSICWCDVSGWKFSNCPALHAHTCIVTCNCACTYMHSYM